MKKTAEDVDVKGRRVLVRADFNVPLKDGSIQDDTRIHAALPNIRHLIEREAAVILCSHLGRTKGKRDDALRLDPVAARLGQLLDCMVEKLDDCVGPEVERAVAHLHPGEIVLLENTRFHREEKENDRAFAAQLAKLADLFVNDAFATAHRAHASTEGVAHHLPAVAGLLMVREIQALQAVRDEPEHPFAAVFGGAKVPGKIRTLEHLVDSLDTVLAGGAFVATLLTAGGIEVGDSKVERDDLEPARRIRERAGKKLVLPVDVVVAKSQEPDAQRETVACDSVRPGWQILDIGPRTIELFREKLAGAKTVIWNGPLGLFEMEPYRKGTSSIAHALADLEATTVVGGGDTVAALKETGAEGGFAHVSTGGGAFLAFLSGEELPALAALQESESQPKMKA